eukprot:scpid20936/ scgid9197/ Non-lysosomal glucosylceramidase; Beta-glucocerebrosidase 2; Glucosylceramidase 2
MAAAVGKEMARTVQVRVAGSTLLINPAERWSKTIQYLRTGLNQDDAEFVYSTTDSQYTMITSDSVWKRALETTMQTGETQFLNLMLAADISREEQASSAVGDGSAASPVSGCVSNSAAGCCAAADDFKQCCHPIAGEFSKPNDARDLPGSDDWSALETPVLTGDECYKCEKMFSTESPVGDSVPPKVVNPTLPQFKYSGEALRACQLPLGPVGGGVIAVAGDGGLRQWQMVNEVNHVGHVPDSFWAIKTEVGGKTQCKVLQSDALYDNSKFVPCYEVTDHIVPPGSIELLKALPGIPEVEITAKYPVVEVDYPNTGLPVDVHMTAWNPCIPLDQNRSGIPIIIFDFEITNNTGEDAQVTLLNSQQNMVGWDGQSPITNGVNNRNYGGNSNALAKLNDNLTAIDMFNTSLSDPDNNHYDSHDGHFASCVASEDNDVVSSLLQFYSLQTMWELFTSEAGLRDNGLHGPSPVGRTWDSALSLTRKVPAKSKTTITFYLAWHFPHRMTNWGQPGYRNISEMYVGNYYAHLYPDINSLLKYTHDQIDDLRLLTMAFRDCMFDSTLPWQLIDSAAGRVSPIRSPTCMWLGDNRLYAFEGCRQTEGCCPLNCTHVWNYEQSLANLWPVLEQTMRDVDLSAGHQVTPVGRLVSRINVPLELKPTWMYWDNYDTDLKSCYVCVDGELGGVLKLYREYRLGAGLGFLKTMWPAAKAIMNRWMTVNDQGDGTMKIAQPNTYDTAMYGVNTFIGALYLCALKASEKMALLDDDEELAKTFADRYALGRQSLDSKCFTNSQWYTQQVDPEAQIKIVGESTFVDCLLGQWWGYILELGDILPLDHCQSTVVNIFARNHRDSFVPSEQSPRPFYDQRDAGMVIGCWPDGVPPPNRLTYTTECAWTGLSHYFAGLCMYMGQNDIAMQVLEDARYCYDGTRRSPWNEIECGDHYSRPMCGFQLFATASGITWQPQPDMGHLRVGFKPLIGPNTYRGFYSLPNAWGQYSQTAADDFTSGTAQITIAYGTLGIAELWLPFQNADMEKISVSLGSANVPVKSAVLNKEGYVQLIFTSLVAMNQTNSPLKVTVATSE